MESIRGTTPQDISKLNTILLKLQNKIFSKLSFEDFNYLTQKKISTHLLPVNGVENLSNGVPCKIFFYIPANKYKNKKGTFNFIFTRYQVDIDTDTDGAIEGISFGTSLNGSGEIMTSSGGGGTVTVTNGSGTVPSHRHDVSISSHSHTGTINVPNHKHKLIKGLVKTDLIPSDIVVKLNNNIITSLTSSNLEKNNIDVSEHLIEGWNIVECSTSTLARVVFYGIIEVEVKK